MTRPGYASDPMRALSPSPLLLVALLSGCPQTPASPPRADQVHPTVVTSSPAIAEMVCALGAERHLIGVSRYCRFPASLAKLPRIGGMHDPNLEVLDGLAPDLILLQGKSQTVLDLAKRRAFKVEPFRVDTVADVFAALTRLGALLDRQERAGQEVARLEAALAQARAKHPARKPKVLLVFSHKPGELGQVSSPGSGTFISECLVAAGGVNVLVGMPPRGYHMVAKEVLLERAPELIIELRDKPAAAETRAAIRRDWSALPSLPAVKNKRIAIVSGSEVLLPGPRLDLLVDKLARVIAGELDVE